MELEEAMKVLKEIQDRCRYCTYIQNGEREEWKKEYQAINVVLNELDKKDKEIERRTEQAKYFSKERNKKIVIIGSLKNKLNDSIPKDKIREYIKEKEEEKEGVKNISLEEYAITSKELKESEICLLKCLLEED